MMEIKSIKKYFPINKGLLKRKIGDVKAVDDISLNIPKGKTIAIVGESGSGKTTLLKTIMRFYEPTSGEIWFDGINIANLEEKDLKALRLDMQMVFQDPSTSLNPRKRIIDILEEPLIVHKKGNKSERLAQMEKLIELVELPKEFLYRYPHSLSGGQKQRIGIARALALNPKFICLDEPTSALDVSVQAKIIDLLKKLQKELGLTYLFITHDLSLVRNFADYVGVMYLGTLVEYGEVRSVFEQPLNPYTQSLLSSIPVVSDAEQNMLPIKIPLKGEIPSPINVPIGCKFHTRCPYKQEICLTAPPVSPSLNGGYVLCHNYKEIQSNPDDLLIKN